MAGKHRQPVYENMGQVADVLRTVKEDGFGYEQMLWLLREQIYYDSPTVSGRELFAELTGRGLDGGVPTVGA